MSKQNVEWVFALDLSAACSGYCFGTGDGQALKYGKYVSKSIPGESRGQKLLNFTKWLSKLIRSFPYKPTRVVVEAPYYRRNVKTFAILNKYVAVAEREIYRSCNLEVEFIAPSAVKTALGVAKGATHEQRKYIMVKEINKRLGINLSYHKSNKNISDDDVADAIALFLTYCGRLPDATP